MGEEGEGGAPGAEEDAPGEVTQINCENRCNI